MLKSIGKEPGSSSRAKHVAAAMAIACACALAIVFFAQLPVPMTNPDAPGAVASATGGTGDPTGDGAGLAGGSSGDAASGAARAGASSTAEAYEPGTVLITLADGASPDQTLEAMAGIPALAGASVSERVGDRIVKIALPDGIGVEDALGLLGEIAPVEAAQPNYRYHTQADPASASAALARTAADATAGLVAGTALGAALGIQSVSVDDPYYDSQWYLSSVNAAEAWETASPTLGANPATVTVAVFDADFRPGHSDLVENVATTYDASTSRTFSSPYQRNSDNASHGTHVAGIIGARANNGQLIAGVTGNAARVLPLRVGDKQGNIETADLAKAYDYLTANASAYNVRVANVSLGAGSSTEVSRSTDTVLYDAIAKAHDAGIVTIAAACNEDSEFKPPFYAYPSDFDNVVSVINLNEQLSRDASSNYNKGSQRQKDIGAPGENILSLGGGADTAYEWLSGTSMASPVAAGVLGLVFAADPGLTADEAVSKLFSTARDVGVAGWDASTGYGEVDAAAAVDPGAPYLSGSPVISGSTAFSVKIAGAAQDASEWAWASSNPDVARPSSTGVVYGTKEGQAVISATKDGMTAYQTVNVTATTTEKMPLSSLSISIADQTYNGKEHTPDPVIYDGSFKLSADTHYTVSYKNNVNAGTARITIKGKAPYSGSVTKTFTIQKANLSKAKVTLSATALAYNGKKRKPKVTVKDIGTNASTELKKGTDFKLSNTGVKRGKGTVTVTAKESCENFTGTVSKSFTVKLVKKKVYALYDKKTKQWFYTAKASERKALKAAGWTDKGVAWKAPSKSTVPVYRLMRNGQYRYTTSKTYRPKGWTNEGIAFYGYETKTRPVYRYYNAKTKSFRYSTTKVKSPGFKRKPTIFYAL